MVLGFKRQFPWDGTPTFFEDKILKGLNLNENLYGMEYKIHSLREDENDRWKAGNSIQMAYGVRTSKYHQFNENISDLSTCKSTQKVVMTVVFGLEVIVDGRCLMANEIDQLIKNDGLTQEQFIKWFFPGGQDEWSGKIIHWTDFKY